MDQKSHPAPTLPSTQPRPSGGRPASLTVFGVLNIVFGVVGICGSAASSAMFFVEMPSDPGIPNPALDLMKSDTTYRLVMQAMLAIGVVFSLVLIAAGVGLLRSKAWGRTLSIAYGWYGLVGVVAALVVNWIYLVQPMLANLNKAGGDVGPAEAGAIGGAVGGLAGGCVGVIYPILLLVFMYRSALRDWLAAGREPGLESPR